MDTDGHSQEHGVVQLNVDGGSEGIPGAGSLLATAVTGGGGQDVADLPNVAEGLMNDGKRRFDGSLLHVREVVKGSCVPR